jgi:Alpha/beta hydrolase domain
MISVMPSARNWTFAKRRQNVWRSVTRDSSIEERYPNHGAYVSAVAQAANKLQQQRLLPGEDVERIVQTAAEATVGK